MVQLICELLLNGTSPSAIPANIVSMFAVLGIELDQVPCVSFCRECRTTCQVVAETLAAYRIGNAPAWLQSFFDGTSRQQIALTTFIIGILNSDNDIVPVTLSSCIFAEDESSEKQVEAMLDMVRGSVSQNLKINLSSLSKIICLVEKIIKQATEMGGDI